MDVDRNIYIRRHQMLVLPPSLFYFYFSHGAVSYRFNEENVNVMLEMMIISEISFLHMHKNIHCGYLLGLPCQHDSIEY